MRIRLGTLKRLIRESTESIPYQLGRRIASGSEGDVYELDGDKVIKVGMSDEPSFVDRVEKLATQMIRAPEDDKVRVFDFGRYIRLSDMNTIYWMVLEHLIPLEDVEKVAVESYLELMRKGSTPQLERAKQEFCLEIADSMPELADFLHVSLPALSDLTNSNNVMKTPAGQYKLIDLEGLNAMWDD